MARSLPVLGFQRLPLPPAEFPLQDTSNQRCLAGQAILPTLWFAIMIFLLHFLPVVFQSNTKISLGQDQAWIYSRDCLCQFCIWVRFPCLVLLAPVLTLVAWFLIAPFCSHSECLLSMWHLICDEPNHFWNGGFTFQQRYSWASNHGSYHQSHWAIPFKPGSNSDLKSWYNIKYNKMSLGFPCFYHPCCFVCEVRAPPHLPLFQNQNGKKHQQTNQEKRRQWSDLCPLKVKYTLKYKQFYPKRVFLCQLGPMPPSGRRT